MNTINCPNCGSQDTTWKYGNDFYCYMCKKTFNFNGDNLKGKKINKNEPTKGYTYMNLESDSKFGKINKRKIITIIVSILLLFVIIWVKNSDIPINENSQRSSVSYPVSNNVSSSNNGNNSESTNAPDNIEAYVISQNFVKDNIVSPSTADFTIEPINVKCIGNKFMVVSYLDAQNSYGAKIREKYMCYLIYNGGIWSNVSNWTLMSLRIGDDIAYINKNKTEQEIAKDIDYLRTQ